MTLASVFPIKGISKSEKVTLSSTSDKRLLAGANKAVWKGPETFKGIKRFTPACLSNSTA